MFQTERKITLSEATKIWPGRPHTSTVWRACRYGLVAANGERVFLEHTRFGGRIYTTPEAVERFGQNLAQADFAYFSGRRETQRDAAFGPARERMRQRQIEQAQQNLAAEGI